MQKSELINQMNCILNNFALVMAGFRLFSVEDCYKYLENSWVEVEEGKPYFVVYEINTDPKHCKELLETKQDFLFRFYEVSSLLKDQTDRQNQLFEFSKMGVRSLIRESFEVIKDYCKQTNQVDTFRSQPWYNFFRLLRNSVSHNFKFHFLKSDYKFLPASFGRHQITPVMDSLDITFSYDVFIDLFKEVVTFVKLELK